MKKILLLFATTALLLSCGGNTSSKNEKAAEGGAEPAAVVKADAVDLGLSVKWAACNLGAATPADPGNYYAWGETAPKAVYDMDSYKLCGEKHKFTKYVPAETLGYADCDNLLVLQSADDPAAALGDGWRMPTRAEALELLEKCDNAFVDGNWVITGPNGNSITIPRAGYRSGDKVRQEKGAYLWCSTLFQGTLEDGTVYYQENYADCFSVPNKVDRQYREYGIPIRPVKE